MFFLTKKHITTNIVLRIPRTFTFKTLNDLGPCKLENIIWNNTVKFKVAYFFGNTKNQETKVFFD